MEDNSYVSLSLEKYNELYDKAKNYDEISEKMTDDLKNMINKMCEVVARLANEESAATEEENSYYDVELIKTEDCIPAGAKGKRLEFDVDKPWVDWDEHYRDCYGKRINGVEYTNVYAVFEENLKKINEKEGK